MTALCLVCPAIAEDTQALPESAHDYSTRYTISPDWSEVRENSKTEPVGAINWTDNFTQFESFSIDHNGNIFTWYKALFRHFADLFTSVRNLFAMLKG